MKRLRLGLVAVGLFFALQRNDVTMTLIALMLIQKIRREPPNTDPWRLVD